MANILDKIVEEKKREVAKLPARLIAAGDLLDAMLEHGERRDFIAVLKSGRRRGDESQTKKNQSESSHVGSYDSIALIAEVKKASPSAGVICKDFDPVKIAKEYHDVEVRVKREGLTILTRNRYYTGGVTQ